MRKVLTIAGLLMLLAVPLLAVSAAPAQAKVCPQGVNWSAHQDPPLEAIEGVTEYCVKAGSVDNNGNDVSFDLNACEAYYLQGSFEEVSALVGADGVCKLSHWSYKFPPPIELLNDCIGWAVMQGGFELDSGRWTLPFELEFVQSAAWPDVIRESRECLVEPEYSLTNTCRGWAVYDQFEGLVESGAWSEPFELEVAFSVILDQRIREPEECLKVPTLEVSCAGWRVKVDGETIEGAAWEDPYSLEVAFSEVLDQRIREPEECLKERGDATLRIGGRCTEDGDSQEIGYVFDDGDFDGARLIITREDGVEVANVGEGSDFFPARAALYGWKIIWFNGETREELDAGRFEVNKCDLPEPTPEPTDTPKKPPKTGGGGSVFDDPFVLIGGAIAGLFGIAIGAMRLWERRQGLG